MSQELLAQSLPRVSREKWAISKADACWVETLACTVWLQQLLSQQLQHSGQGQVEKLSP
jgi:hypothetical protein